MTNEDFIKEDKLLRQYLDGIARRLQVSPRKSRHRSLAITHLEDAVMRLGKDLQELGTPDPYPNSKDPSNAIVDRPATELRNA